MKRDDEATQNPVAGPEREIGPIEFKWRASGGEPGHLRIGDEDSATGSDAAANVENGTSGLTRRQMLKITAGAVAAAPLVGHALSASARPLGPALAQDKTLFFTPEEFAMVDELTEIIIPADAHSPGARAAEVATYIDARVAEAFEPEVRDAWRNGLKSVDQLSQATNGVPFMKATPEQRHDIVTKMARGEMNPEQDHEHFFRELKGRTAQGYYTSKVGIH
ncbi:MAG TPA: gluconate 2-dehydrogenase subunit 3 family protein, partial [Blastocatellia bacterium]